MVIQDVGVARKALAVYDRQQLYADRTARIKHKTFQVGVADRVTLSGSALARGAISGSARPKASAPAKSIIYENPAKRSVMRSSTPAHQATSRPLIADR